MSLWKYLNGHQGAEKLIPPFSWHNMSACTWACATFNQLHYSCSSCWTWQVMNDGDTHFKGVHHSSECRTGSESEAEEEMKGGCCVQRGGVQSGRLTDKKIPTLLQSSERAPLKPAWTSRNTPVSFRNKQGPNAAFMSFNRRLQEHKAACLCVLWTPRNKYSFRSASTYNHHLIYGVFCSLFLKKQRKNTF